MSHRARLGLGLAAIVVAGAASTFLFFFFRDNFSTHYPIKVISAGVFRSGEIPYWNFFDGGGQPLAGNPNFLTYYPDNFLYVIFPAHAAFNLHFIVHLTLAWFAMRALSRSSAAAWLYVLSGIAISATAFYNLIVALPLVPLAFWAAERRSASGLGIAFGLLALAGEPVTIIATAIGVLILWPSARLLFSVAIAFVIALPQLIAYWEIASEVERAHGYSAQTVLNASLSPIRLLEILIGPFVQVREPRLFLSLFVGVIAIPALLQRSRYVAVAAVMLFFAVGRFNPIVAAAVDGVPGIRVARYPEKFAIPMMVAIVVLSAKPLTSNAWRWITFPPLVAWAAVMLPIDLFAPYRVASRPPLRLFARPLPGGQELSRSEYHLRAQRLDPLFGAVAGLRYAVDRSPDGMFSLMTRIAAERFDATHDAKYLRIAGCSNVPGALPRAMIVPLVIGTRTIRDAVQTIESATFDEHAAAIGPQRLDGFRSPAAARVMNITERSQALDIRVATPASAILLVNETYFRAWDAGHFDTFPLDLDRLGILVPAGESVITLRFGRHHLAVAAAWMLSSIALILALFALRVEVLDRRPRQVERAADEDGPLR